jgi:predicted choloylglycine hydrolase
MIDQEEKERLQDRLKELLYESHKLSGMTDILYYVLENTYIKKRFIKNVEDKYKSVRDRHSIVRSEIQSIYIQLIPQKPIISKEFLEQAIKDAKLKYGIDY